MCECLGCVWRHDLLHSGFVGDVLVVKQEVNDKVICNSPVMNERGGSSGGSGKISVMSDMVKIANMVVTGTGDGGDLL